MCRCMPQEEPIRRPPQEDPIRNPQLNLQPKEFWD